MNPFIKQPENIFLALSSQILSFHSPLILPVLVVQSISMLHSMSLAGLQMVTACHPPCPGKLLNEVFEAGSSSLHKEKCQKRITPGGGEESGIPLISYLLFFLPFFTDLHCAFTLQQKEGA